MSISTAPVLRDGSVEVYTDGSKSVDGVHHCSILQAEISAIKRTVNCLMYYRVFGVDIQNCTESQAAIKSLSGVFPTSGWYMNAGYL